MNGEQCPVNAETRAEHLGSGFKSWDDMEVVSSESLERLHKFFKAVKSSQGFRLSVAA